MRIIGNDPSIPRKTQVVASGTLSTGDTVVVNSDGTVSVAGETSNSASVGTPVALSQDTQYFASYDVASQKVVVSYRDKTNSDYGTAVVGTVSGTSISFGTAVVFNSATTGNIGSIYDPTNSKTVIFYNDSTVSRGNAVVGTVSGTSISFGSESPFNDSGAVGVIYGCYDTSNNKIVLVYSDNNNSNFGTAVVGTVSGTSISFGTKVVFYSDLVAEFSLDYDESNQKVVVTYRQYLPNLYGESIVGTVSGTSISFGSAVTFNSDRSDSTQTVYDPESNKVVVFYKDTNNSGYGTAMVGTVSGSSISFGSKVVFNTGTTNEITAAYHTEAKSIVVGYSDISNSNYGTAVGGVVSGNSITFSAESVFEAATILQVRKPSAYDPITKQVLFFYNDDGNAGKGTYVFFSPSYTSTNLTAENFIGTAKSGAADGDGVVVNTQGTVDDNQAGLTAGQSYYVQTDGTLGTTAGTPSVFAGTAVSSTKLIVKG